MADGKARVGTLLVLGALGDLTERLLLPGLATLLASDWQADRPPPLLVGAGRQPMATGDWRRPTPAAGA